MKCIAFFAGWLVLFTACKKDGVDAGRIRTFTIHSTVNGGTYDIKVALPPDYNPGKKYAVLYVLDPKWDFDFVASECDKQAAAQQKDGVLVVGIGWGHDRVHDYSPVPLRSGKGGADAFARFIKEELVPAIERDYPAATTRAGRGIIGHSAGGLFALHCFVSHNDLFARYIALSPSLWVGNQVVLVNEKKFRPDNDTGNGSMFLAVGELEQEVMHPPIELFRQVMHAYYPGYASTYHLARGLDHMGSKNINIPRGIFFYFKQL